MPVARATRAEFVRSGRVARVLLSVAFLATVAVLRAVTLSIRHDWVPFFFDLRPGGRNRLAVGYGVRAALTLDEFALLLRLDDVYWDLPGRVNLVAVAALGVLLLMVHDTLPVARALAR